MLPQSEQYVIAQDDDDNPEAINFIKHQVWLETPKLLKWHYEMQQTQNQHH